MRCAWTRAKPGLRLPRARSSGRRTIPDALEPMREPKGSLCSATKAMPPSSGRPGSSDSEPTSRKGSGNFRVVWLRPGARTAPPGGPGAVRWRRRFGALIDRACCAAVAPFGAPACLVRSDSPRLLRNWRGCHVVVTDWHCAPAFLAGCGTRSARHAAHPFRDGRREAVAPCRTRPERPRGRDPRSREDERKIARPMSAGSPRRSEGRRALDVHALTCRGMRETHRACVEAESRRHRAHRRQRVEVITKDRVPELAAMHAQLVAATGAGQQFKPCGCARSIT